MLRLLHRQGAKAGTPAGTLAYVGGERDFAPHAQLARYDADLFEEIRYESGTCPVPPDDGVAWLRVVGLHDVDLVRAVGEGFGLHAMLVEDILNTGHMPKFDEEEAWCFLIVKSMIHSPGSGILTEHLALAWDGRTVVSFQQNEHTAWDSVVARLRRETSRLRRKDAAHLVAALLDAVIDENLMTVASLARQVEELEARVPTDQSEALLLAIYGAKRDLVYLKNSLRLFQDALRTFKNHDLVTEASGSAVFFTDVYEHLTQSLDAAESLYEVAGGMLDVTISLSGMRMNAVMKFLTAFAAIFIPLTFIAGIYGMNFQYMPELSWKYGYFIALGGMALLGAILGWYFARKKWF